MNARPRMLIAVVGTGTDVGKTWAGARLCAALVEAGWSVAVRKPAQSGDPGDPGDATVLAAATGEPPEIVCPPHRRYPVAMAPPMAAEIASMAAPTVADLVAEVEASWPDPAPDVGVVETAGGVASPMGAATPRSLDLAASGPNDDAAALCALLDPDVVLLVADAGLGTLSATRTAIAYLRNGLGVAAVGDAEPVRPPSLRRCGGPRGAGDRRVEPL
ncbi:MAG: dethiobiotin synthase [Microthrixaceae bacterium]